ncbi:UNVERIFIED_CONTAM: hypothetical protein K2H54_046212 [Gekko kuhli]
MHRGRSAWAEMLSAEAFHLSFDKRQCAGSASVPCPPPAHLVSFGEKSNLIPRVVSVGELELTTSEGENKVFARQNVPEGLSWGPFRGNIHAEPAPSPGHGEMTGRLLAEDPDEI